MKQFVFILALVAITASAQRPFAEGKRIVRFTGNPNIPLPTDMGGYVDLGRGFYDVEERVVLPPNAVVVGQGPKRLAQVPASDRDELLPHRWLGEAD